MVTLSASIYPPYVASKPLEDDSPVVVIVVSDTYTFASSPVANTAFAPFAFVVILEFFIVVVLPFVVKIPAFTP